jgi:uncharacterized protein YbjT (DUF2867 family)
VRVFVLGGTGSIGSAIVRELVHRGHEVHGLVRSDASAKKLAELGATPLSGDIALPEQWLGTLPHVDAMIHAACDFSTAMGEIDRHLLDVLLPSLSAQPKSRVLFIPAAVGYSARPATMSRPKRRRSARFPPSPGWCRTCSAFSMRPGSTAS